MAESHGHGNHSGEAMDIKHVLVTGATGFLGAHVVDALLEGGFRVRAGTRSLDRGHQLLDARPQARDTGRLEVIRIGDFAGGDGDELDFGLREAAKGVDAVVHIASPFIERVSDNEGDLVLPAIGGVKAVLSAAAQEPSIKRVAITSSVAAVMDLKRQGSHIYTASDWSPMSYAEAIDPKTDAFASHRGSKKFAELAAWDFMRDQRPQPSFELVTLCPPLIYGPMVHPRLGGEVKSLNSSNGLLWKFATGEMKVPPGPGVRFWVDVRDLATAHVEAVRRSGVGGRRFVVASGERARYETAGEIIREGERFGAGKVSEKETMDGSGDEGECEIDVDGWTAERELGIKYRSFRDSVGDLVGQVVRMRDEDASESLNM